jgi:alpha-L-fucosidase
MKDEKFGLYAHWGLYSVPGFGMEWYGKRMYEPESPIHQEHVATYGSPAKFGYKDFVGEFTALRSDPAAWAELFQYSGAGYAGFSLAHHDGFGLWDSDVYRWNVGKMGPKRDLYGELASELRKREMRLVAPFHIILRFNWFLPGWNQWEQTYDTDAVERGKRENWDLYDPEYADFYQHQIVGASFDAFLADWKAKVKEVIDKYRPALMWFDGGRFSEADLAAHSLEVLSYYLNRSVVWRKRVCVLNKLPVSMKFNFRPDFGVRQFEEGRDRPATGAIPGVEPATAIDGRLRNDDMRVGDKSWG